MFTKRRVPLAAALVAGTMLSLSAAASAGSCPTDKVVADGQGQRPSAAAAKDVSDTVLGSIDLATQPAVGVADRQFRMRRLAIKPGGVVPWHGHDDRPALIYVAVGEVTEYASNCAAPIVHNPGEVGVEVKGTSHWWRNTGSTTAVLISADLVRQADDAHTM
jgi:quercetin dioxygenase-like cupin family protein